MTHESQSRSSVLAWQSRCVLALVLIPLTFGIASECVSFARIAPLLPVCALSFGVLLALLVWRFRAATPYAAVTGGLVAAALYIATPGWRTALWPLIALLLLTLTATRFGRSRKEKLGVAEARSGRTAAQVAANLGVATLASMPLGLDRFFSFPRVFSANAMRLALVAALAEAAADTLSSEFGEVLGGEPRLLTSFRRVPAGTDGAISLAGTASGLAAAAMVSLTAAFALDFTPEQTGIIVIAAIVGLFVDSLLGAVLERRGWLNNDAVNFLSTLASAVLAATLGA
jgi:uncharacterized protein (TIGR00297 family)